ncbi:MAG: signal peptidase II [Myxococcota bacterium]|nr:signal peptidase II [Myxococcota bacterium]
MSDTPLYAQRKTGLFVGLTALLVVLDQLSKWWVRENIALGSERVEVIPGLFELVHVENTGAAFGMLSGQSWAMWLFIPFTVIAGLVLVSMLRDLPDDVVLEPLVLGSIFGGAMGNFLDRVRVQGVTDFLRVYTEQPDIQAFLLKNLGSAEWPSFNVADIAIVVGVTCFVAIEIFGRGRHPQKEG